ncbi:hypothetical protein [Flavobacterium sp. '19STA2R22 D10 B1']|uniref:hypothetical protein n=1 Tax=Flavobacterium aerium TaxID=3037261 RepID=UPI00278C1855|nr:hypothetical protein [Flavobacterium sp. '19STA2R22 D10 B1']
MKLIHPFIFFFQKKKQQINFIPEYYDTELGAETMPYIAIGGEEYALYTSKKEIHETQESILHHQSLNTMSYVDNL